MYNKTIICALFLTLIGCDEAKKPKVEPTHEVIESHSTLQMAQNSVKGTHPIATDAAPTPPDNKHPSVKKPFTPPDVQNKPQENKDPMLDKDESNPLVPNPNNSKQTEKVPPQNPPIQVENKVDTIEVISKNVANEILAENQSQTTLENLPTPVTFGPPQPVVKEKEKAAQAVSKSPATTTTTTTSPGITTKPLPESGDAIPDPAYSNGSVISPANRTIPLVPKAPPTDDNTSELNNDEVAPTLGQRAQIYAEITKMKEEIHGMVYNLEEPFLGKDATVENAIG